MTAQAIDFFAAVERRRHLRQVACSEPWVETVIVPATDGEGWRYLPDTFPPGGSKTKMRVCPRCHRICPPAVPDDQPCSDCMTEGEERRYVKWILRRERRELRDDMARLWWRGAIPWADLPFVIDPEWKRRKRGAKDHSRITGFGGAWVGDEGRPPTAAEEGCAFDIREVNDAASLGGNETQDQRIALEIARRRLDPPKKEKGRASGCQVLLLPESEKALRQEIAYFHKKHRVRPSARRYSRPNPHLRAPEDRDFLDAL